MDKKKVYIETSIISYLTARPSSHLIAAAWQKTTLDWWENQRDRFELYVSATVIEEIKRGDPGAAARRLDAIENIRLLPVTDTAARLAKALIDEGAVPRKALEDALHIAISVTHSMDYLLTWNCRHIDNAEIKPLIRRICAEKGYVCPEICTPQELMGVATDD